MNVLGTGSETKRIEARGNKPPTQAREGKVNVQTFIYVPAIEHFKALQLP